MAAFGVPLALPAIVRTAQNEGGNAGARTAAIGVTLFARIASPGVIVAVASGVGLVLSSDEVWSFSQPRVSAAFTLVLLTLLIGYVVVLPALKKTIELGQLNQ